MHSQSYIDYNRSGDEALSKEEYDIALNYYNSGLNSQCNIQSVQKIVDIWQRQPDMRESMQLEMLKCFNCLKKLADNDRDSQAMLLLGGFYRDGIGIEKNPDLANYWHKEYVKEMDLNLDDNQNTNNNLSENKTPRKNRFHSFITYTYSPTMPFGLTAGIYFDKIGGYVSGRTNSKSFNAIYECNNTHIPEIEVLNPPYEFNREHWHSQMITGGLLLPILKNRLFVSAGGGYGKRNYYREIITEESFSTGNKSEWCLNTEACYEGLTLEAGGMFIWKKIAVVGGVNSTKFKDFDVYFGLGLTF